MSEFFCDILYNILSRLPAKFLLCLRAVCKLWKRIIDDPFFVKSHTKNQQSYAASILIRKRNGGGLFSLSLDRLNYADGVQQIDIIPLKQLIHRGVPRLAALPAPSCNGLILISHHKIDKSWVIWNPLVQDFHEVPPPPVTDPQNKYAALTRSGFGYDEASDDYKVVRVDRMYKDKVNEYYRCMIYSLKSRCWRAIEGFPGGDCWGDHGVYLNGALHWRSRDGIITLHLGRENHYLVAPGAPPPPPTEGRCWESLDALDGCLIWSYGYKNLKGMDAWVMKDKAWTKLFSVESESDLRGLRVVAYLKSKGQVFLKHWGSGLQWLDLEDKSSKEITFCGVQHNSLSYAQFSSGSLLRLDNNKSNKSRRAGAKRKRFSPGSLLRIDNNKSRRAGGEKRKRKMEGAYARCGVKRMDEDGRSLCMV